jgi:uncharacterized protein YndB with AHSA1/START domain
MRFQFTPIAEEGGGMSENVRNINASIESVWSVLANGETYDQWVVGAEAIRSVEDGWPAVGSKLHHTVKAGPARTKDDTEVLEVEPRKRLKLRGRARPYGIAEITLDLRSLGSTTDVAIHERVVSGPGALLPNALQDLALKGRNARTLKNLADLAEHR